MTAYKRLVTPRGVFLYPKIALPMQLFSLHTRSRGLKYTGLDFQDKPGGNHAHSS